MGEARQYPLLHFLEHILPPLRPNFNPANVVEALKNASTQKPITSQNRWRGFTQDPAASSRRAYVAFRPLEEVAKAICITANTNAPGLVPLLRFQSNTRPVMKHKDRRAGINTFPDAFLSRAECKGLSWPSLAVCGEYRRKDDASDVNDVRSTTSYGTS